LSAYQNAVDKWEKKHLACLSLTTDQFDNINIIAINPEKTGNLYKSNFIKLGIGLKSSKSNVLNLDFSYLNDNNLSKTLSKSLVNGVICGLNDVAIYKTEAKIRTDISTIAYKSNPSESEQIKSSLIEGYNYGVSINKAINLVNAPSNFKTPITLADFITNSAKENGFLLTILEKKELEEQGFDALLAVNRGSEIPAKFLIGEYKTANPTANTKTVVLVGKGVTFDTGGVSMKTPANMHYMKSDMGGSAAVLGTIDLVSKLKLNVNLIALVPTTDNSVDALSIKPGDVISSYAKKTIEVIDTDAEGRLILADGLAYAVKNYNADYLIDLATLTGSVVRALGSECAGIMSNDDNLCNQLIDAGGGVGERLWRLPLWEEYFEQMESDIADIKNLSTKPVAGAITAGKFLEFFIDGHKSWAHLDIAGTAFGTYPTSKGYSATGFGIDLLTNWMASLSK
jgi:leucyl aminopeptidase